MPSIGRDSFRRRRAVLYTWSETGCAPTYNAKYQDATAPQPPLSFLSSSSSCSYFGWGVFTNLNMGAYAGGQIQFYLKSTTSLEVQLQDQQSNKATVLVPSTGGQWQLITYPVSTFTDQGLNLSQIYGVFLITDTNGPATFYVDEVVWSNGIIPPGAVQVTLDPAPAVSAGAQWSVNGGGWQASGATVTNLTATNATISFKAVPGWSAPAPQTVLIASGLTTNVVAAYLDAVKPTVAIVAPKAGLTVSNAVFTVTGTGR